jgi:hypothetical protein
MRQHHQRLTGTHTPAPHVEACTADALRTAAWTIPQHSCHAAMLRCSLERAGRWQGTWLGGLVVVEQALVGHQQVHPDLQRQPPRGGRQARRRLLQERSGFGSEESPGDGAGGRACNVGRAWGCMGSGLFETSCTGAQCTDNKGRSCSQNTPVCPPRMLMREGCRAVAIVASWVYMPGGSSVGDSPGGGYVAFQRADVQPTAQRFEDQRLVRLFWLLRIALRTYRCSGKLRASMELSDVRDRLHGTTAASTRQVLRRMHRYLPCSLGV